jgi:hypothetical protein
MIYVLLDTSIYRSDPPRRRAAFQTLTALCEAGEITLHVPSIVKREFVSHFANKAEALLAETLARVKKLRKAGASDDTRQTVSTAVTALEGVNGVPNVSQPHRRVCNREGFSSVVHFI